MKNLLKKQNGMIVVEAAILLPIIFMIFFALIILCFYLPTRAALQRSTQDAATIIATEKSDTWFRYDIDKKELDTVGKSELTNVYIAAFEDLFSSSEESKAETIINDDDYTILFFGADDIQVECKEENYIIYKEIIITATKTYITPVDFSFIGFPNEIPIEVTSRAIVQNGDEFVRNIDIAVDAAGIIDEKYGISENFEGLKNLGEKFSEFLG